MIRLFAADGITLPEDAISSQSPPAQLTLTRDSIREKKMAAFLLDETPSVQSQGGGIYLYQGANGEVLFRANGSFEATLTAIPEDAAVLYRDFCKQFSYEASLFLLDQEGNGSVSATCLYDQFPVFNGSAVFSLEADAPIRISGTLLPTTGTALNSEQELLSAPAALIAFHNMRRETGAVVSAVTEIYPCYRLQSTTAVPMSLTPAWCITTDTSKYYVNCVSGAVTSA